CADSLALPSDGSRIEINSAMIPITTRSSTSVKARERSIRCQFINRLRSKTRLATQPLCTAERIWQHNAPRTRGGPLSRAVLRQCPLAALLLQEWPATLPNSQKRQTFGRNRQF